MVTNFYKLLSTGMGTFTANKNNYVVIRFQFYLNCSHILTLLPTHRTSTVIMHVCYDVMYSDRDMLVYFETV